MCPNPSAFRRHELLSSSLFLDAATPQDRVWAADLALRSGVCAAVVVDGSGFSMCATRRLQLATEAGGALAMGGVCLLARPPREEKELSAATTRWVVRRAVGPAEVRRWSVELLRCKGMQPSALHAVSRPWVVEHDHATGDLRMAADLRDGLGKTQAGQAVARTA
ncbi:MAG: hypothetical protein U0637_08955 [Phycisphaerales bacterium]